MTKTTNERLPIMSDANTNPADPKPLTDEELSKVSGGTTWNYYDERGYREDFDFEVSLNHLPANANFEDYLRSRGVSEDQLKCRDYYIAHGSPWDSTCFMDSRGNLSIS